VKVRAKFSDVAPSIRHSAVDAEGRMLYAAANNHTNRSGAYADKARQSRWFACWNPRLGNGRFP
jgi:hypothetical protein